MSKALLAVSFGTSYAETRKLTLEAIEDDLKAAFPDRAFYRAWTSGRILKKLRAAGGPTIDTLEEALERMAGDGVTDLLVQPTFLADGYEMKLAAETLAARRDRFETVALGKVLLAGEADLAELAALLEEAWGSEEAPGDMLAFMGHGSDQTDFDVYAGLQERFRLDGYRRFCVGTVEFSPGFAPVLEQVRARSPQTVWLAPLMVVAGDHANNDMAGDGPESWKSRLEREGVAVRCVLKGLGEYPAVRRMYVAHARAAAPI